MKKIDVIQPAYFNRFVCMGPECKYTCCQEWNIFLTRSEYTKIKSQIHSKDMLEAFCAAFVRQKDHGGDDSKYAFVHYNSSYLCPLQTQEGMCSLQLQCGHQVLPITCQVFPRSEVFLINTVERNLSLGCEGVVKLLLEERNGICLEVDQMSPNRRVQSVLYITKQDAEKRPVYYHIWDIKTLCAAMLQDRSHSLDDRMLLLGVALGRIQRLEQENRTDQISSFVDEILRSEDDYFSLEDWNNVQVNPNLPVLNALIFMNQLKEVSNNPHLIRMVEELLNRFQAVLDTVRNEESDEISLHFTMNKEKNQKLKKNYDQWLEKYDYFVENIMVAWFFSEQIPFSKSDCTVWEHYIYFCSLYNLLKIILMGTVADPEWTMEQVIHNVTVCARTVTHSATIPQKLIKRAVESGSDTLAHMAILIKS